MTVSAEERSLLHKTAEGLLSFWDCVICTPSIGTVLHATAGGILLIGSTTTITNVYHMGITHGLYAKEAKVSPHSYERITSL